MVGERKGGADYAPLKPKVLSAKWRAIRPHVLEAKPAARTPTPLSGPQPREWFIRVFTFERRHRSSEGTTHVVGTCALMMYRTVITAAPSRPTAIQWWGDEGPRPVPA